MICPDCRSTNLMGFDAQGVYDGVLAWQCLACGLIWPRDFGDWERLNTAARKFAAELSGKEV